MSGQRGSGERYVPMSMQYQMQNTSGQIPSGQNPYGQNSYVQNPYGVNPNGQNPYGVNANGQNPYGVNANGQNPYGANPNEQNPYGVNPYAQNPYGQNPYGQNMYGQSQPGQYGQQMSQNVRQAAEPLSDFSPYGGEADSQEPRRSGGKAFLIILLVLAVAGVGGWLAFDYFRGEEPIASDADAPATIALPDGGFITDYQIIDCAAGYYIAIDNDAGKFGLLDSRGFTLIDFDYDGISFSPDAERHGFVYVDREGKWGMTGYDGTALLPAEYDSIVPFEPGLNLTTAQKGDDYYIISADGSASMIDNYTGLLDEHPGSAQSAFFAAAEDIVVQRLTLDYEDDSYNGGMKILVRFLGADGTAVWSSDGNMPTLGMFEATRISGSPNRFFIKYFDADAFTQRCGIMDTGGKITRLGYDSTHTFSFPNGTSGVFVCSDNASSVFYSATELAETGEERSAAQYSDFVDGRALEYRVDGDSAALSVVDDKGQTVSELFSPAAGSQVLRSGRIMCFIAPDGSVEVFSPSGRVGEGFSGVAPLGNNNGVFLRLTDSEGEYSLYSPEGECLVAPGELPEGATAIVSGDAYYSGACACLVERSNNRYTVRPVG